VVLGTLLLLGCSVGSDDPLVWETRNAEHLLNRAAFGASTAALERAVAAGPAAVVDGLLAVEPWVEEPFYPRKRLDGEVYQRIMSLPVKERNEGLDRLHDEDRAQSLDFLTWWIERMLAERDPLRERMVLFWHGHFTSSLGIVKSSYEMVHQNQLFRRLGLGDFRLLLREIVRDPAMLLYLDSASNYRLHANENFARELLELYTLGEGKYTEADVQEVARAFTGWGAVDGRFSFNEGGHDTGVKRVLGVEGELDGDDVVEILLAQEACARHIARSLMRSFEGLEPEPARLESYAASLRTDWRIDRFLRRLFLDPAFYRDEARASRVSSPLDYLVGMAHRVGVTPDSRMVFAGAALLGQRLFFPPTVRGWEGGQGWATTSALVLRGGFAGVLLGRVPLGELLGGADESEPEGMQEQSMASGDAGAGMQPAPGVGLPRDISAEVRVLQQVEWRPRLNLTQRFARRGAGSDEALARALVEELLAVPAPPALVTRVAEVLQRARAERGLGEEAWTSRPELCEPLLRELAHAVLSLPEAQLD